MSLVKAEKTENANRVKLEISIDAETFEKAIDAVFRKNAKQYRLDGCRPGHLTRKRVEWQFGKGFFYEDAFNELYPTMTQEAIDACEYDYVDDHIDVDVQSIDENGVKYTVVITVKPECKIDGYKGLKAEKPAVEVSDDDVNTELERLQERQSRLVDVTNRAAQDKDIVMIDYEGFADGVAFDGGKGENQSLTLGSGQFIPGFEEQIVGKTIGEEFDVNVTFPTEYHAEELAGKEAVFKCKLHEIKMRELPALDDELAKDCSEFDTLDELKADVKAKLTESAEKEASAVFENALAEQLGDLLEADIPQAMIENAMDNAVQDFDNRLKSQGLALDMYLQYTNTDMKTFRESTRESSEKQVKVRLALEAIAKQEGIEVAAEDIEAEYAKIAEMYQVDLDQVKSGIPEKSLREDLAVEKAMAIVKDNAKVGKPAAKKAASTAKKPAAKKAEGEEKPAAAKKPAAKKTTSTAKKPAAKKAEGEEKPAAAKKPAAKKTTTAKKPTAKKTEE